MAAHGFRDMQTEETTLVSSYPVPTLETILWTVLAGEVSNLSECAVDV